MQSIRAAVILGYLQYTLYPYTIVFMHLIATCVRIVQRECNLNASSLDRNLDLKTYHDVN